MPAKRSTNFALLDGLRGLGALFVLYGHTAIFWSSYYPATAPVLVDLFFLLSGFVIAYAYEPRLKAGMRAGDFIMQRIVRLFPLYLLGILFGFTVVCVSILGDKDGGSQFFESLGNLIPQLFLLPAPPQSGSPYPFSMNPPAWTLLFEFAVNLFYLLIFRWLTTRNLVLLTGLCAAALIFTVFTFGHIDVGSIWPNFWGGLARASFGFFAGVLVFRLVGSPVDAERPVSNWSLLVLLYIPFVCVVPATPEIRPILDCFLAIVVGVVVIWLGQSIATPNYLTKLCIIGGRISYAIYILHWPFREIAERLAWRTPLVSEMVPLTGIVIFVTCVAFSYFAEKYFDTPVRKWLTKALKQRGAQRSKAKHGMPTAAE